MTNRPRRSRPKKSTAATEAGKSGAGSKKVDTDRTQMAGKNDKTDKTPGAGAAPKPSEGADLPTGAKSVADAPKTDDPKPDEKTSASPKSDPAAKPAPSSPSAATGPVVPPAPGKAGDPKAGSEAGKGTASPSVTPPAGAKTGTSEPAFAARNGLDPKSRSSDPKDTSAAERKTALAAAASAGASSTSPTGPSTASGSGRSATPTPARRDGDGRKGGGFGTALAAAVLGAILALGGAYLLQLYGYLPGTGADAGEAEVAASGDLEAISTRLDTLEGDIVAISESGTGGASAEELASLGERIGALESLAESEEPSEAVSAAQASADEAGQTAGEALQAAQAAQQAAEAAQQATTQAQQAAQAAQQTATAAQQAATAANQAVTQVSQSVAEIESLAGDLEQRMAALEESNRQAAIALSAAGLKNAIDRGGPFMAELEAYASAAGPSDAVESLRDYAAEGVPTAAELAAAWPEAEDRILAAIRQPAAADGSLGDQVLSSLQSLVTVRPAGPAPESAEGPEAAIARLDAAIASGDLQAWLQEWQSLPEAGQQASAAFADQVRARAEAERIVGETLAAATGTGSADGAGATGGSQGAAETGTQIITVPINEGETGGEAGGSPAPAAPAGNTQG